MEVSPARLPRLLGVLVFAFAPAESRPLLGAVELFRGLSIQLCYRWATGRVFADPLNRAVLLWSEDGGRCGRHRLLREVAGVLSAVVVGIAFFAASNTLLLLLVREVLRAFETSQATVHTVWFVIVMTRLLITMFRAVQAYRHQASVTALLPGRSGLRWRIDYLAATPARCGHGGHLLHTFLKVADSHDAEVVLSCDSRNVSFYRAHGFHFVEAHCPRGQRLMIRRAATARRNRDAGKRPAKPVPHRFFDEGVRRGAHIVGRGKAAVSHPFGRAAAR